MKYNYSDIKDYVRVEHPNDIRTHLWVWLMFLDFLNPLFFGIEFVDLGRDFSFFVVKVFFLITILLNLWTFFIMINPEKWQKQFILYMGIVSLFMSMLYFFLYYEYIYSILNMESPIYMIVAVLLYIGIFVAWAIFFKRAFETGYFSDRNKKKGRVNYAIIGAATGIGIIGSVLSKNMGKNIELLIFALGSLLFAYTFESASHMIYRYYLIKKYEKHVKTYTLSKKERKK